MFKFLDFFITEYKKDDHLTQKQAKSFTLMLLLGIALDILYLLSNIFFTHNTIKYNLNFFLSPILFLLIIVVSLYLVKIHRLIEAGNFSMTSLILIEAFISFVSLKNKVPFSFVFAGTYYYMLMLLGISVFFTSNFFLSLNTVLIIFSSILNLIIVKTYATPEALGHLKTATIDFLTATIALYAILIFSKNIVKSAFNLIVKEKNEKDRQNEKLSELFEAIRKVVVELETLSKTLTTISKLIVERSSQQASSIQQVAFSTQKINDVITETYTLAQQTQENASNSFEKYLKSKQILNETIESFLKIINQIKHINEFADKTEILAINAAIEAAHASEIASGFSVIAQEIRELSDFIKQHSLEISQTAQTSQKNSTVTLKEFDELTSEIQNYTEFIQNISQTSQILFQAIKQIYKETSLLSEHSEKNLTLADKLQKTSDQLSAISKKLKNMISSI